MGKHHADLGIAIGQAITGVQSAINANNDVDRLNSWMQNVATLATIVASPEVVAITNAEAALITIGKIINDQENGKSPVRCPRI